MNPSFRLTPEDIKIRQEDALEQFYSGIKSEQTKRTLGGNLKYFLLIVCSDLLKGDYKMRAQQFVEIARDDQKRATGIVMAYVKHLASRTALEKSHPNYIKPSYVPNKIKPIQKLLVMNELGLPWKKIRTLYPEIDNATQSRGYTREEIKKMLEFSDGVDTDFIILASSSGGLRVGAWEDQRWENIRPIYEIDGEYNIEEKQGKVVCATMIVYKGTSWEYQSLISIEAWEKLLAYKKIWTGIRQRTPNGDDPLLLAQNYKKKPLTVIGVKSRIATLLEKSGLRTPLTEGKRLHDVPATHGFRRYWNKVMMQTKRKKGTLSALVTKEYLLGHRGLVKTDRNYFWVDILEQVSEYLEAMPELMISDETRLRQKLEAQIERSKNLETANEKLQGAVQKISELESKVRRMEQYRSS